MYQTYITEALVCGSFDRNGGDRSFLLFTRLSGMVSASARSVRKEHSKQRFALQDFSHIRASLVGGKGGWRIAGVESLGNAYFDAESREMRAFVRNIVRLLRRVAGGETPHEALFDDITEALRARDLVDQSKLELALTLRVLHVLGYVPENAAYRNVLNTPRALDAVIYIDEANVALCTDAIRQALLESQL